MAQQARIFFLHNPKAGGSSLRETLLSLAPGASVAPVFANAPNDARNNRADVLHLKGYDFYAGHYGYDVYRKLRADHILVTNFRHPVRRIHSLYRYWRNNVDLSNLSALNDNDRMCVELAHNLNFSVFIRSDNEDLRLYIENFHFRQLLSSGWDFPDIDAKSHQLVRDRIERMNWFYIAETPDASTTLLRKIFPDAPTLHLPHVNRSEGPFCPISPEDEDYIRKHNNLDIDIYAHALNVQKRRLQSITSN